MTFKGDLWQRRQCTLCSKGVYTCLNSRVVNRKTSLMIRYTVQYIMIKIYANRMVARQFGRIKFWIFGLIFFKFFEFTIKRLNTKYHLWLPTNKINTNWLLSPNKLSCNGGFWTRELSFDKFCIVVYRIIYNANTAS